MVKEKLDALREAVLGRRGREVEVAPDGQVIINPEGNQNAENPSGQQETETPKPPKMSPHTWGI